MVKEAGAAKIVPFVGEVIVTGGTAATKDERSELSINRKTTASQRVTHRLLIRSISAELALCLSRVRNALGVPADRGEVSLQRAPLTPGPAATLASAKGS